MFSAAWWVWPVAALLVLGSALAYGIADFVGGLLARRADPTMIALIRQAGALVLTAGVAPRVPAGDVQLQDLGLGALSRVGTGIGIVFLYRGLEHGGMSVVMPVVAVVGTALPVLFGIALLGDRPTALSWLGIALALPALWPISVRSRAAAGAASHSGTTQALISSLGIALQ